MMNKYIKKKKKKRKRKHNITLKLVTKNISTHQKINYRNSNYFIK